MQLHLNKAFHLVAMTGCMQHPVCEASCVEIQFSAKMVELYEMDEGQPNADISDN